MGTGSFFSEIQEHKDIFLLKIGTDLLQIGELFILQIEALVITNRGTSYYKSGQHLLLQVGAELLQIVAVIKYRRKHIKHLGICYKLVHNNIC